MNDSISRQAVIDAIVAWTVQDRPDVEMPTDLIDRINALSSAEPEREKGKWIICSDGYYPYCSNCRHEPESGFMTNFCPNCGADMRGEQNEND